MMSSHDLCGYHLSGSKRNMLDCHHLLMHCCSYHLRVGKPAKTTWVHPSIVDIHNSLSFLYHATPCPPFLLSSWLLQLDHPHSQPWSKSVIIMDSSHHRGQLGQLSSTILYNHCSLVFTNIKIYESPILTKHINQYSSTDMNQHQLNSQHCGMLVISQPISKPTAGCWFN